MREYSIPIMRWLTGVIVMVLGIIIPLFPARIYAQSSVIVVRIQTGSKTSASEELIELFNTSTINHDIHGWRLEYVSASPKDFSIPSRTIFLSGSIAAQSSYIVASTGYMNAEANLHFAATLANAGGHLRLRSSDMKTTYDLVGWGTATHASGNPARAPAPGEILRRQKTSEGDYRTSGDNEADFSALHTTDDTTQSAVDHAGTVTISELLPNPGSPLTDTNDEFIELYNRSSVPVQLLGYSIWAGANLSYSYKIPDITIRPDEYKAFFSRDTRVALSNSGGRAVLKNPEGTIMSETSSYEIAGDNTSWSWDGSTWIWSSSVTPNAENVVDGVPPESYSTPKVSTPKASKNSKVTTKKSVPKVSKPKAKEKKKAIDKPKKAETVEPAPTLHPGILAGVGGSAVLYGAYEYRRDAATFIQKLREYRSTRRKNR